jgi:hypothetical protein
VIAWPPRLHWCRGRRQADSCGELDNILTVRLRFRDQFPKLLCSFWCHECTVMLKNHRWRVSHFCSCKGLVLVECEVIGAEGVTKNVPRPGGEFCEGLQPLMPFAVTVWNDPGQRLAPLASAKKRDYRKWKRCASAWFSPCGPQPQ